MSSENQEQEVKQRLAVLEKEIFNLRGNERINARVEYYRLLKVYSKECGLEEPIYLARC